MCSLFREHMDFECKSGGSKIGAILCIQTDFSYVAYAKLHVYIFKF